MEYFKLEYESKDNRGCKLRIWSGPSVKGDWYKNIGVDPSKDRVFYIQIARFDNYNNGSVKWCETYRFKYEDQIKLLELVLNNKQKETAKVDYILLMIEKLFSWLPENYHWPVYHTKKLKDLLKVLNG